MPRSSAVALCMLGSEAIKMYSQQFAVSAVLVLLTDIIKLIKKKNIWLQHSRNCHLLLLKEPAMFLSDKLKSPQRPKCCLVVRLGSEHRQEALLSHKVTLMPL